MMSDVHRFRLRTIPSDKLKHLSSPSIVSCWLVAFFCCFCSDFFTVDVALHLNTRHEIFIPHRVVVTHFLEFKFSLSASVIPHLRIRFTSAMSEESKRFSSTSCQVFRKGTVIHRICPRKNSFMANHSVEVPRRSFLLSVGRKMTFIHPTLMARRLKIPSLPC